MTHHSSKRRMLGACLMGACLMVACLMVTTTALTACATPAPVVSPAPSSALAQLRADAAAVAPFATHGPARDFLQAVITLPEQAPRQVFTHKGKKQTLAPDRLALLPEADRVGFEPAMRDAAFFYSTYYGTPVAYVRALDVAGAHGLAGLNGTRVLDIGYGAIGAVRMMAGAGAEVSALDVDDLLTALYRDRADQGIVRGVDGRVGALRLFDGVFAGDTALTKAIGRHFDLIVTKNTFKRGFMKPANGRKPVVDFGVSDAALLAALRDTLAPGGLLVIYNLAGKFDAARPSTDGRSPFDRAQFEAAGFDVLALDASDDSAARALGQALGWAAQMGDLNVNLFTHFSVLRARPVPAP
jgi:hypothetical protein